jgi:hypothetical protein
MYSKEEIIQEIKRVAEKLGTKALKRKDFEKNTTIPPTTLRYYFTSWSQVLKEAELETPGETRDSQQPQNDDELLLELIRLHDETGETPTAALVNAKGKFESRHYDARWKSIGEAFKLAREKFPPKPRTLKVDKESIDIGNSKKISSGLADFSELGIYQEEGEEETQQQEIEKDPDIVEVPTAVEQEGTGELPQDIGGGEKMTDSQKIILIPQTIKPKIAKKKPRFLGEPVQFRGLKFAPVNEKGVAYLFGMVSLELGFVVEALRTEPPDCEGKRCLDTAASQWEPVKIDFLFKSSDFKTGGHNESETDIIVCWAHDWEDCPVEVLELKSIIRLFEDSK